MDRNLFDISNWNKKIDDKSHEDRFKDWVNGFANPIKFEDKKNNRRQRPFDKIL